MAKAENNNPSFNNVAIIAGGGERASSALAGEVSAFLKDLSIKSTAGALKDKGLHKRVQQREFDLVIALGGDGTVLRVGHLCAPLDIPVLAINQGHFGFLIEVEPEDWRKMLPRLKTGE